ncbi:MAG: thylakoid membrane photosystem I accumulation factor [Leptolyngbyaceae bacterium]|nr:thylakoid membrane photosystem I accumulation factor [Leptolyngbyaceae bacterium]
MINSFFPSISRRIRQCVVIVLLLSAVFMSSLNVGVSPAHASLTDDRYDGNIFALYAGNGSIIPPRLTLAQALERSDRPAILGFYVDDSSDCKQFSTVLTQLDAYYGRAADIILLSADALPVQDSYEPTEAGYYYSGYVPQTLIFNKEGEVVFDEVGQASFEKMDDILREIFDLLPRSESIELKRRIVNEVNVEMVPEDKAN